MGGGYLTTACPLCRAEFDDPEAYRAHLADEHDLVDDEGAETVLPTIEDEPEPEPDPEPQPELLEPLPQAPIPPPQPAPPVAMPVARPTVTTPPVPLTVLAIAAAIQLLLGLIGIAVVGGDGDEVARSTVITEPLPTSTPIPTTSPVVTAAAPAAAPAPAAPVADAYADRRRAEAITPTPADFPPGWVVDASAADAFGFSADQTSPCGGSPSTNEQPAVSFVGLSSESAGAGALGLVAIEKTADIASAEMAQLKRDFSCMRDEVIAGARAEIPDGVSVDVSPLTPIAVGNFGDESIARTMAFTANAPGATISLRFDIFAIRKDRTIVLLMVMRPDGAGLTTAQERAVLRSVAARM